MPRARKIQTNNTKTRPLPSTPEAAENEMIASAYRLAQKQLEEGTASAQVITHFLKLGSTKERLEKEKLIEENKLLRAKTEALKSNSRLEELFTEAMTAFSSYRGGNSNDDEY